MLDGAPDTGRNTLTALAEHRLADALRFSRPRPFQQPASRSADSGVIRERFRDSRESSLDEAARVRLSQSRRSSTRYGLHDLASPRPDRRRRLGVNTRSPFAHRVDAELAGALPDRPRVTPVQSEIGAGDERGHRRRSRSSAGTVAGGYLVRTATLDEVARAAGVSRATASRVVNGSTTVRNDARESVERAVT